MPQLTIRSALTGMLLGSVLSLTNLYIGIQTGWTLGVGITSVILAFAAFKILGADRPRLGDDDPREQRHAEHRHRGRLHDRAAGDEPRGLHDHHRTS